MLSLLLVVLELLSLGASVVRTTITKQCKITSDHRILPPQNKAYVISVTALQLVLAPARGTSEEIAMYVKI
jgi:hypothetical protein